MTAGTVAEFSEPRGIGVIEADGTTYAFHCTQIADGTRTVRIGAAVEFDVVPGRRGDRRLGGVTLEFLEDR